MKGRRACSICGVPGHRAPRCPGKVEAEDAGDRRGWGDDTRCKSSKKDHHMTVPCNAKGSHRVLNVFESEPQHINVCKAHAESYAETHEVEPL